MTYSERELTFTFAKNPVLYANLMALSFIKLNLWVIEVYIAGLGILDLICSYNLDLEPTTFIYKLDPYFQEIQRIIMQI